MLKVISILLLATVTSCSESEPTAWILATKGFLSTYAVENMDYVVEYGLHNVGEKAATKVVLDDRRSFPAQYFEIVKGKLHVRFERIGAGENATHAVVLRPRQYGLFNYTAAQITYNVEDNAKDVRIGYSSVPGEGYVYKLKEYERKFAPKWQYWIGFFLMVAPTTLGSFYAFNASRRKYEALDTKKKTH